MTLLKLLVDAVIALSMFYLVKKLNQQYRFSADILKVYQLTRTNFLWWLAVKLNRVSAFNVFEHYAKVQPNHTFLKYVEPLPKESYSPEAALEHRFRVRSLTYKETYILVQKFAAYLYEELNVRPNDVVAMDCTNNLEFVIIWFAIWNLGAIPSMINYNLQSDALMHCLKVSNAKFLLYDPEIRDNVLTASQEFAANNIKTVETTNDVFSHAFKDFGMIPFKNTNPKGGDPGCYIFTSGTSGFPKAASVSWKKLGWGALIYATVSFFDKDQVLFSPMPLYHSTAAILGFMSTLQAGSTYAIGHKFSASTFWTQAMLCEATAIQYVGEVCRYLLNTPEGPHDRSHKIHVAHGNGLRAEIWKKFKTRFNIPVIAEFYAATEFPMALNNYQEGDRGIGACGSYGLFGTWYLRQTRWNIAAVDQDTGDLYRDPKTQLGKSVGKNEPGEMMFKIISRDVGDEFQGYVGNQSASEEKVARNVFKRGDKWVRSGDLLKFDSEMNVMFVDRMGDTFRWKSENVSTTEVESAVLQVPNVDMAVCVGVKVPEHEGRAGFAVIKPVDASKPPSLDQLAESLPAKLPKYAVPLFIKFVDEIPTTGSNKVMKRVFRDQKIPPAPDSNEIIYWLQKGKYVPLTHEGWEQVESGQLKL